MSTALLRLPDQRSLRFRFEFSRLQWLRSIYAMPLTYHFTKWYASNISSCPHNMANVGKLTAEIGLPVWGTPAHFNGFRVLAALGLLHGTLVVGVSQTLRR